MHLGRSPLQQDIGASQSVTRIHLALHVRDYLDTAPYPEGYENLLKGQDAAGAFACLLLEKHRGHTVIPMSAACSPSTSCTHREQGCTGFDYTGGGCPGYIEGEG